MALPSDLTTIVVTGTYTTATGTPAAGSVIFYLPEALSDSTGKVILGPGQNAVTLNSAGSFSVTLPCTDNANLNPTGFTYTVLEQIPGLGRSYSVALPHTLGSTVDISALAPVAAVPAPSAFAAANTWTATQAFSASPGLKITAGAASGDVLTSDASGNATWAAPAAGGITPPAGDIGGTTGSPTVISTHLSAALPVAQGGTGQASAPAGFNALSPMTALGDTVYGGASGAGTRLAGNTASTKNFLTQTGTGIVSAAPAWAAVAAADLPAATTSTQGAVILDGTAADIQPAGVQAAGAKGQAADAKHAHPFQPWQFLPEVYGAKGDGVVCTVNTTVSSTTITATSAVFTSTGVDGGKHIMIHGANGSGSGPLITTIVSVTNSTTAVLAAAAGASVNGCPAVFGTDDTAAVKAAAAAAGTYALANSYFAEVVFAAKIYVLASGPTQTGNGTTTPTFNTQVPLPYPAAAGTSQKLVITLTGAGDNGYYQYWGSLVPNVSGTALVSMLTTGTSPDPTFGQQSVIGGPSSAAGFSSIDGNQAFANTKVVVQGMAVWLPLYTNIYAYDFGYVTQMRAVQSGAFIFAPTGVNPSAVQPWLSNISAGAAQSMTGCGFKTPINQNNADNTMDDCSVEGFGVGYRVYDHLAAGRLGSIYNVVVMAVNNEGGLGHLIAVQMLDAEVYTGGILTNAGSGGTCTLDINMDTECGNGSVLYDIKDPANTMHGMVRFRDSADSSRTPILTGAANVKFIWEENVPGAWSGAPAVPASTVAQQNTSWRDAAVSIKGGTVTVIAVDGATVATATNTTVIVPSGKNIALTYSVAPTWAWTLL